VGTVVLVTIAPEDPAVPPSTESSLAITAVSGQSRKSHAQEVTTNKNRELVSACNVLKDSIAMRQVWPTLLTARKAIIVGTALLSPRDVQQDPMGLP